MGEQPCPTCGHSYDRIAQHWAASGCGYPELRSEQRAVLDGLMLAGGTIAGNGSNRHLTIGSTNAALAEWTADELDWLHHGTRETESGSWGDSTVYRIRTPAHPQINQYERWERAPESKGRIPPNRFDLSPRAGRVWYAFAGGLMFREYDTQRSVVIPAKYGDKADWIQRVLSDAGFDSTRQTKRVQVRPRETTRFLSWIGGPPPGVEEKWRVSDVGDCPVWKDRSQYPPQFPDEALENALLNAADSFGRPPTTSEFDAWKPPAYPTSKTLIVRGGRGWTGEIEAVGLDAAELIRATHGSSARYPRELLLASIREAQSAVDAGPLTLGDYRRWRECEQARDRVIPAATTIQDRFPELHWDDIVELAVNS